MIRNLVQVWSAGRRDIRPCFGVLGGVAVLFLLTLVPRVCRSEGDPPVPQDPADPAPRCGRPHPAGGDRVPVDLGAVRKASRDLEDRLGKSLKVQAERAVTELPSSFDAGLPACRGGVDRMERLAEGKASRLRGRVLVFLDGKDPERVELPPEIAGNPRAEILLLRVTRLGDLPRISGRLGRPVGLGSPELAKALGVRCASTWLCVSEKGDELELHERR